MAYEQAFHAYRAILDSFFRAYSAIVDSVLIKKNITKRSSIVD